MDVFHGNLEAIETAGFCDLNFLAKALHLVVKHITVQREAQPFRGSWIHHTPFVPL